MITNKSHPDRQEVLQLADRIRRDAILLSSVLPLIFDQVKLMDLDASRRYDLSVAETEVLADLKALKRVSSDISLKSVGILSRMPF